MAEPIMPQQRVYRRSPCPICRKPTWCFFLADGTGVVCMRAESGRKWGAGWLHPTNGEPVKYTSRPKQECATRDFETVWRDLRNDTPGGFAGEYAAKAELDTKAIKLLGCCRHSHGVAAFPMFNEDRCAIGIRLRSLVGKKWAITGSKQGLFIPDQAIGQRVIICEGPTDTAAVLALGLYAIGRPSCQGCEDATAYFCRGRQVAILSDYDDVGYRGSVRLASVVARKAKSVKIIEPLTGKDVREWATSSATLEAVISAADLWAA